MVSFMSRIWSRDQQSSFKHQMLIFGCRRSYDKKKAIIAYNHILKLMSICIKYFYRRYKAIIYALRYMKHTWSSYINMLFS